MTEHKLFGELFNSLSDYLTVFIAGSISLLEDSGELIFITPSFWMHTQHSEKLRNWLLSYGHITDIVDFGEAQVFPKVNSAIVIFRFQMGHDGPSHINHYLFKGRRQIPQDAISLENTAHFNARKIPNFAQGATWTLATSTELQISKTLEEACLVRSNDLLGSPILNTLGEYVEIANGMVTGLDKVFQVPQDLMEILNSQEQSATLRVLKAKQIENLLSSDFTTYIDVPPGLTESEFKKLYPNFNNLLEPFREQLDARYNYRRKLEFWEWAFKRSQKFFENGKAKGFVPCKERITNRELVRFTLAPLNTVATQDVTAFAPKRDTRETIEYIVAYLNLPQISEWVRRKGLLKGGIAEFSERPLASIPFRRIDWDDPTEVTIHNNVTKQIRDLRTNGPKQTNQAIDYCNSAITCLLEKTSL